ncbi:MAG TPA: hypothetical protein DEQ61_02100 [Streptomyces sp.]|nr:hypothetical protein [Streptomyces sp.]
MRSAGSLFQEIFDNDAAFRLFCSVAASTGEQGGWESSRIAKLLPPGLRELAPKIARHGADEDKHGRIFHALLRKRGLRPATVPADTDYAMLLERRGIGPAHDKLRRDEPLTERDIVVHLARGRVTEQRSAERMLLYRKHAAGRPDLDRAFGAIAEDDANHLAYCHEELLRLAATGHGRTVRSALRESALAEIRVHRDVSLAVLARMGRILRWSRPRSALLAAGVHARYAYERLGGLRRMTRLRTPERLNALGGPATPAPEFA